MFSIKQIGISAELLPSKEDVLGIDPPNPKGSIFMVNVGKYTIHGSYGNGQKVGFFAMFVSSLQQDDVETPDPEPSEDPEDPDGPEDGPPEDAPLEEKEAEAWETQFELDGCPVQHGSHRINGWLGSNGEL